jgi:hypothetical protein
MPRKKSLTYQDYAEGIQHLTPEEQLGLIELISAVLKKIRMARKENHSVLELEGLGSEVWKGIDPKEYLLEERQSWD